MKEKRRPVLYSSSFSLYPRSDLEQLWSEGGERPVIPVISPSRQTYNFSSHLPFKGQSDNFLGFLFFCTTLSPPHRVRKSCLPVREKVLIWTDVLISVLSSSRYLHEIRTSVNFHSSSFNTRILCIRFLALESVIALTPIGAWLLFR